ncbi:hypothetical protein FB99_18200 [Pantoea agglomerans]|nr:hypothetical protein FB99_18200 [Pantoea agglomerans]
MYRKAGIVPKPATAARLIFIIAAVKRAYRRCGNEKNSQ